MKTSFPSVERVHLNETDRPKPRIVAAGRMLLRRKGPVTRGVRFGVEMPSAEGRSRTSRK